jgi:hypothetical protein
MNLSHYHLIKYTIFSIVLLALYPNKLKAQSTDALDINNGYGQIKFNLSLKELKRIIPLTKIKSETPNDEFYTVKNPNDFKAYGYNVEYVLLSFYKEALYQIQIKIEDQTEPQVAGAVRFDILRRVRESYGPPTIVDTSNRTQVIKKCRLQFWSGKNVTLVQAWPWGEGNQVKLTENGMRYFADTWYFINHETSNRRTRETDKNTSF